MTTPNFDCFEENVPVPLTKRKVQLSPSDLWKKYFLSIYQCEFDLISDANLYISCKELSKYCTINALNYEKYIEWGMINFDLKSPRYLSSQKMLLTYKQSLVPEDSESGFFIIETGEIVSEIYKLDGQLLMEIPSDGTAYINENLVHVVRV